MEDNYSNNREPHLTKANWTLPDPEFFYKRGSKRANEIIEEVNRGEWGDPSD